MKSIESNDPYKYLKENIEEINKNNCADKYRPLRIFMIDLNSSKNLFFYDIIITKSIIQSNQEKRRIQTIKLKKSMQLLTEEEMMKIEKEEENDLKIQSNKYYYSDLESIFLDINFKTFQNAKYNVAFNSSSNEILSFMELQDDEDIYIAETTFSDDIFEIFLKIRKIEKDKRDKKFFNENYMSILDKDSTEFKLFNIGVTNDLKDYNKEVNSNLNFIFPLSKRGSVDREFKFKSTLVKIPLRDSKKENTILPLLPHRLLLSKQIIKGTKLRYFFSDQYPHVEKSTPNTISNQPLKAKIQSKIPDKFNLSTLLLKLKSEEKEVASPKEFIPLQKYNIENINESLSDKERNKNKKLVKNPNFSEEKFIISKSNLVPTKHNGILNENIKKQSENPFIQRMYKFYSLKKMDSNSKIRHMKRNNFSPVQDVSDNKIFEKSEEFQYILLKCNYSYEKCKKILKMFCFLAKLSEKYELDYSNNINIGKELDQKQYIGYLISNFTLEEEEFILTIKSGDAKNFKILKSIIKEYYSIFKRKTNFVFKKLLNCLSINGPFVTFTQFLEIYSFLIDNKANRDKLIYFCLKFLGENSSIEHIINIFKSIENSNSHIEVKATINRIINDMMANNIINKKGKIEPDTFLEVYKSKGLDISPLMSLIIY